MNIIETPHIVAEKNDFAETVLMPGDPLRAKMIAEKYLSNAKLVNNIRGIQGYTGTYKGKRISVMASGMGMPSMGIYSYELFKFFDVKNIIRIGSAGAISDKLNLGDIIIAMGACTDSNFAAQFNLPGVFSPIANFKILRKSVETAEKLNIPYHVGNILTSDVFYDESSGKLEWSKMGVLAVDMETAALYITAARLNKNALSICTISDCLKSKKSCSADERQNNFTVMIETALNTALNI